MEASKEEGLRIGLIPEKKFETKCIQNRIVYVSTRKFEGWTNLLDKINGDYLLLIHNKLLKIDVKGGAISKESILNFVGDYFVIFENSNESASEGLVFTPRVLKNLIFEKPDKYFDAMALSGEPGILYSRLIQLKDYAVTISDFFKSLNTTKL